MTVTQRGELSAEDKAELVGDTLAVWAEAEALRTYVRSRCVEMVDKSSFRAVAEVTGFSTNTLQRWKREASK